ncbi:type I polyketide synthase, partial [Streptomyces sp. NPDC056486]|uniref:type I polyketide synthase n=1 Tax=Streptomyces sp. NPDC056486 TaxID=3345835 RepID=UPI0036C3E8A2
MGDGPDSTVPVAVVGMACRLPGAENPEAYWTLLREGVDAVGEVPADRWNLPGGNEAARPANPGTRRGGFLPRVDLFDAEFFNISPREAAAMDPQQRLMLELSWEVMEDAGIVPDTLHGSATGVFTGVMWDDYATLARRRDPDAQTRHSVTGTHRSVIANRVSYAFGLRGPSLAVDSGQSSSLVAVHMACESLRAGTCTLALAGGVNLNLAAESTIGTSKFGALSPDGRCFTFDARANGFVRGEGGGVVLLKQLDRAVADGDFVYCVIRGSAVNNDGATDTLTHPSVAAQAEVVRTAQRLSGVGPDEVAYVELHGTGTRLGDPVEAAALGEVFGSCRTQDNPVRVGSAKTNVGHLEGAAGITGLLKTALSLTHAQLPPSLNFEHPNPSIPLPELGLRVQTTLTEWPGEGPRTAGVSSFGMGGTNCHMVLSAAPSSGVPVVEVGETGRPVALVLSARGPGALAAQGERLRAHLVRHPALSLERVAGVLASARTRFDRRAVVSAGDRPAALAALTALARGLPHPALVTGPGTPTTRTVFLFPGQGCQYPGMGAALHGTYPVFTDALDQACQSLDQHLEHPLRDIIFARPGTPQAALLDRTDYTQPALFALGTALYHQLTDLGITPDLLIGHSIGEITAAHCAGILTLTDAAHLITTRARLMHTLPPHTTGMITAHATHTQLQPHLTHHPDAHIAAYNSPTHHTIAATHTTLKTLQHQLHTHGIKTTPLHTTHAFHTPHMDPILT